jgi:serine phosphatase RsbU (regulator of sigma subunit)
VLIYTDGLIEGRVGRGPERLGSEGLIKLIEKERAQAPAGETPDRQANEQLIDAVITMARELNGGDLEDDLAVLVVSCSPPDGQ